MRRRPSTRLGYLDRFSATSYNCGDFFDATGCRRTGLARSQGRDVYCEPILHILTLTQPCNTGRGAAFGLGRNAKRQVPVFADEAKASVYSALITLGALW